MLPVVLFADSTIVLAFAFAGFCMVCLAIYMFAPWVGIRYVPNDKVGRSRNHSWGRNHIGQEGTGCALKGETGFQPDVLRGGIYFNLFRWKYLDSMGQSYLRRDSRKRKIGIRLCPRRRALSWPRA